MTGPGVPEGLPAVELLHPRLDVGVELVGGQADRDRLAYVQGHSPDGVHDLLEAVEVDDRVVADLQVGDALDGVDRGGHAGVVLVLVELLVVLRPGAHAVEVAAVAVEAARELLVHRGTLGEGEVLHVARQADEDGATGDRIDRGDRERVGAQAPAGLPAVGVGAGQQDVEAAVVGLGGLRTGEDRLDHALVHPDEVGAEDQGRGDGEGQRAVDRDHDPALLEVELERTAQAPGVHEESGPGDGTGDETDAEEPQQPRGGTEPEDQAVPQQGDPEDQPARDRETDDGPDRDPADPAVAGDELRGPRQEQRDQQQRHGTAEPHAGGALGGRTLRPVGLVSHLRSLG